ncbi:MAG: TIGR03915 family putative DNA repair protein [Treponema sp.]|jgi:probable DNA metabolism protein|nr:TIGR03915 family putative DNA repair protein [Treponema sp.]
MSQGELFNPTDYDSKNYNNNNDPYFNEKIGQEVHRMMGFLRFTPDKNDTYIARCAPDYFVLPALGEYFTARFGEIPWEIIDEKRGLSLSRQPGKPAKLIPLETGENPAKEDRKTIDEWEELWKHYHKTINNESRNNPNLQRQFMPQRYWKYLPEKETTSHL